ncbi:MAG TPA: PA14 domain-containing protein [Candidatus Acidoferrales bacterium]|nr:PA14 domain-containing protein [Candidatus Acidoferrales bacterium]
MPRFALTLLAAASLASQEREPPYKFGTTVVLPMGLRGQVYHLHRDTQRLPDFRKMKPVGSIYTSSLNIPPQSFQQGFPGVTKRFEWFAIDYNGRFWIANPGLYRWSLLSDDGSELYIDDQLVIENDGVHFAQEQRGALGLAGGVHRMRVSYFQGPRFEVALVLKVAGPGERFHVFTTDEFKPPPDAQWTDPVEEPQPKKRK